MVAHPRLDAHTADGHLRLRRAHRDGEDRELRDAVGRCKLDPGLKAPGFKL